MGVLADISVDVNTDKSADVDAAVAAAAGLRLMGFSARSAAGATFEIVHGATADGGTVVVSVALAAAISQTVWFGNEGIPMASGISLNRAAGTFDCHLYTKTIS